MSLPDAMPPQRGARGACLWRKLAIAMLCLSPVMSCLAAPMQLSIAELTQQVTNTERAFAKTMAERDHAGFASFLSDEAVFLSGAKATRGKVAVAALWKPRFEGQKPPFSWEPGQVEILDSGTLALSTGPVRNPDGKIVAEFTSIWRLENAGNEKTWRIVFDKGNAVCDCLKP